MNTKRLEETNACRDKTQVCLGKIEATIKVGQEEMRAKIKTGLEEKKATELEDNQQKIQAIAKHYEGVPYTEAMQLLTALQDRATYGETIWAIGSST
jgi:hypothetical protein